MKPLVLDFETHGIEPRASPTTNGSYPPEPVSYAYRTYTGKLGFVSWGHPSGNNGYYDTALDQLADLLRKHDTLIAHNLPFEVAILLDRCRIDVSSTHRWIDTQVMCFLVDPYSPTLELKPLAERWLGEPPDERDAVRDWLVERKIVSKQLKKGWAAHISKAPANIVKPYAIGDVTRAWGLFQKFKKLINTEPFKREMALQPALIDMEARGVPIDRRRLAADLDQYESALIDNEKAMRRLLRDADVDFAKREQVAQAIRSRYPEVELAKTPTGRDSTARGSLEAALPNGVLKARMVYDSSLRQTLKMFLRPWHAQMARTPGRLHPGWNGTRNDRGGARTGRLSSTPNLQNLNDHEKEMLVMAAIRKMAARAKGLPDLPALRDYVQAPTGFLLVGRDYSQIELRATAHFEAGPMRDGYVDHPQWDLHDWVVDRIQTLYGRTITRRVAKNVGFGIIYGAGGGAISAQSGLSYEDSIEVKSLYLQTLPSLYALMRSINDLGKRGAPIETLGGRIYFAQPADIVEDDAGNILSARTYEYKLLNYLIQGTCADLMKEAMILAHRRGLPLIMSIHDEPVTLSERSRAREVCAELHECMVDDNIIAQRISVPILTEGYTAKRWATKQKVK